MGYAQLVIGPAGSGKSTYCSSLYQHCTAVGRRIDIVNLDPAAENFDYPVSVDIRELVNLDEVMEDFNLGPNGGLICCMEFLEENLDDWLAEELESFMDDDYLVFDCPGQIELFSHVPVLKNFVDHLKRKNFNVCAVYLLDSQFITDITKFISGCMACLSAMVQLELPHINILSKMDLVTNKKKLEDYLNPEPQVLLSELNQHMAPQFEKLNRALIELNPFVRSCRFNCFNRESRGLNLDHVMVHDGLPLEDVGIGGNYAPFQIFYKFFRSYLIFFLTRFKI
ncbi:GPN-loop GTPase [Dillenia turbinata]|uniref:GPN-loop GTPase 3 n=1 Tax=Dillenia turbinata TaxID=194707 RepID=A0AAN8V1S6_9MAGN